MNVTDQRLGRPLLLWRSWRVRKDTLYAPLWRDNIAWEPGAQQAECGRGGDHSVPHSSCGCGWYGYYEPTANILPHPDDRSRVLQWHRGIDEQEQLAIELGVTLAQLYAWHAKLCARAYDDDSQLVDGLMLTWGTVEAHHSGARTQWAQPWGLLTDGLNQDVATRIQSRYSLVASDDWRTLLSAAKEWGQTIDKDHPLRGGRDFPGLFGTAADRS